MDDEARYERAKKRVEDIKGFYSHLVVYVLVNAALLVLNLLTSPGGLWFQWPLFFWGIGIVAHAASVFGPKWFLGAEWERRKIEELMDKEREKDPRIRPE